VRRVVKARRLVIIAKPARGMMMGKRTRKKMMGKGLIQRLDIMNRRLTKNGSFDIY
jgi:hypothetical protein